MDKIFPAFEENNIAIVMTSSDFYSPYIGVLLSSIIENSSKNNNYDILVLQSDISEINKIMLRSIISNKINFSLRFIDVSFIMDKYSFDISNPRLTKYTFYRLTIYEILTEYGKVVYFDSDIVVNADVAELYNYNISDFFLGACKDVRMAVWYTLKPHVREYNEKVLQLKEPYNYFNAGVVLYNLEVMRQSFTTEYLLKMSASRSWHTVDQDVLNLECAGRVVFLPYEWNITTLTSDEYEKELPDEICQAYYAARENPKAIHYVGGSLPCNKPEADMYHYFWKYARNTPFYELILSRMIDGIAIQQTESILYSIDKMINESTKCTANNKNTKAIWLENMLFKQQIKDKFMPMVNVFLPKGTKRREIVKHIFIR
jgi:lipopolysaccharide biosynthesis glycosyltransferase